MFRSVVIVMVSKSKIKTIPKHFPPFESYWIPFHIILMYCINKLILNNLTYGRFELLWNSYWKIQHIMEPIFLCQIKIEALINYEIVKCNSQACPVEKCYFGIIVASDKINRSCWINDRLVIVDEIENGLNEYISYVKSWYSG